MQYYKKALRSSLLKNMKWQFFGIKKTCHRANEHMEKINTKQNWYSHKIDKNIYIKKINIVEDKFWLRDVIIMVADTHTSKFLLWNKLFNN